MKTGLVTKEKCLQLRRQMNHLWVTWGLFPLGIVFIAMLALASPEANASPTDMNQQQRLRTERKANAVLAISGLLFFVSFSLDGRWTDAERVGRRILRAAGGDEFIPTHTQLAAEADLAVGAVNHSVVMLTVSGLIMGALAVAAVAVRLPLINGLHLLALAAIFQLFVFSRHPYYSELVEAALCGELVDFGGEDDDK